MDNVTVRKLMRSVFTVLTALVTVGFFFMVPAFLGPDSEVGIGGVIFKVAVLLAAWVFVYKLWKIDVQPVAPDA